MSNQSKARFTCAANLPPIALGTAGLGERTTDAVCNALQNGYTLLDCALLYGNQEDVGKGIQLSGIPRENFKICTKVGVFPPDSEGVWMYNPNNIKGQETDSINMCLNQLNVKYVDLLLLHNPLVSVTEFNAASCPFHFELANTTGLPTAITPKKLPGGEEIRPLILDSLVRKAKNDGISKEQALERRKKSWSLIEKAFIEGKAKMIGVSNFPAELLDEMKGYAKIMPKVNQVEFHPRYWSPSIYSKCIELGITMMSYGILNSWKVGNKKVNDTILEISSRMGRTPVETLIRWTVQKGVVAILRSGTKENQAANLAATEADNLSDEDMQRIDSLEENYPYYFIQQPTLDTIEL